MKFKFIKNIKVFVLSSIVFSLFFPFQNCAPQFEVVDTLEEINQLADPSVLSPPVISFASDSPTLFNSNQIQLSFDVTMTGSSPLRSVMCQLNESPAVSCNSFSVTFSDLADGDYTLRVFVETMADVRVEATRLFRKDSVAPVVSVSMMPSAVTNQTSVQFQFSSNDSLSGVLSSECSLNNAAFSSCTSPVSLTVLPAGAHNFRIRSIDRAGNVSSVFTHNWTVDLAAPTTMLTSTPQALTNSTTASFVFSGNGIVSYECQLDNGAYAPCTSPRVYNNLTAASHTFRARGTNGSGNVSSPVQFIWTVDNVAPTAPVVTASVGAVSNVRTANMSFVSTDRTGVVSYQCSANNAAFANCTSPLNLTNLVDGVYNYRFRALDGAGNVSAISPFSWTVDATVPVLAFTQAPTTSIATTVTIAFNVSDAGTGINQVQCSFNNAAFANCTSPVVLSNLMVQSQNFRVQARDNAGNMTLITHLWTTNVAPPPLTSDEINLEAGRVLYAANCAACHNPVDASTKRGRTSSVIAAAIGSVPTMTGLSFLNPLQLQQISRALSNSPPPTTNSNGRSVFACDPAVVSRTPMIKLTNREFRGHINSLLDGFQTSLKADSQLVTLFNQVPSDILPEGHFASREQPLLLTNEMGLANFEATFRAGALVAASSGLGTYPNTNGCLANATISQTCHQSFVRELASRSFRKSLSTTEGNSLAATLWDASLTKVNLLQLSFVSIVQMPDSMYKVYDQGVVSPRGSRILSLTAHELANKLSYFITGLGPDATLRTLAANGQILDPAILSQQTDRLFLLPSAQENIQRFFRETYGYDRFGTLSYSNEFLDGLNTSGLGPAMLAEMDQFFPEVVLNQNGTFSDIMNSRTGLVNSESLAQVYGVNSSPNPIQLPVQRSGFLNRGAFLTRKSGSFTSPIKRGLFVLESVLCESVGNPPPNAPTSIPTEPIAGQYVTTRQRTAHTSEAAGSSCITCHSRINSLGYPYEQFDSIGRFRISERIFASESGPVVATLPVVTTSTSPDLRFSQNININDSMALSLELSNNDKAMMCFAKAIKSFEAKISTSASDNCQMNTSLNTLYGMNGSQGSIKEAMKSIILSNEFRLWSY